MLAWRFSWFSSPMRVTCRFSCAKLRTTRMPLRLSCRYAVTSAIRSRVIRYALAATIRKTMLAMASSGNVMNTTSARPTSSSSMITITPINVSML